MIPVPRFAWYDHFFNDLTELILVQQEDFSAVFSKRIEFLM